MRRLLPVLALLPVVLSSADFDWRLPPGFPQPVIPADNPMTADKVELGRYLFYDSRMSGNGKQSCASCHRQELAFTDGRGRGLGSTGELHPRGPMGLVNIAYAPRLTWANPTLESLEDQALAPMFGTEPVELGLKGHETKLVALLKNEPVYRDRFPKVFGEAPYTVPNIIKAIAAFERSIISMRSPYDRYRWGGEPNAISESAKRGEILFSSSKSGGCFQCHGGWNFSGAVRFDGKREAAGENDPRTAFFNTGVSPYKEPNRGIFEHTKDPQDLGKFRAPSLRNIAVTAPYMHDGNIATLEDVLDHYMAGGRFRSSSTSGRINPFSLSQTEKADLLEFLKSLTDDALLRDQRWSNPWPSPKR
ncbi:MAG: MbnH family di-heme enzyme [Pseudomonadota bacterium]|jgi:cytochrome c peroxidase